MKSVIGGVMRLFKRYKELEQRVAEMEETLDWMGGRIQFLKDMGRSNNKKLSLLMDYLGVIDVTYPEETTIVPTRTEIVKKSAPKQSKEKEGN